MKMKMLTMLSALLLSASVALASADVSMNILALIHVKKDKAEAFELIRESGALACNPEAWAICVEEDVVLFVGIPNLPVCQKADMGSVSNGRSGGSFFRRLLSEKDAAMVT